IIGGQPERFAPLASLYRKAASQAGHDPARLPISINSHAYVAPTSRQAGDEDFPPHPPMMKPSRPGGGWTAMTREQFEAGRSPRGALVVGSPKQVVEKILFEHEVFGHQRFMA